MLCSCWYTRTKAHLWSPARGSLSLYSNGYSKVQNKDNDVKLLGSCAPEPFECRTPEHMLCFALLCIALHGFAHIVRTLHCLEGHHICMCSCAAWWFWWHQHGLLNWPRHLHAKAGEKTFGVILSWTVPIGKTPVSSLQAISNRVKWIAAMMDLTLANTVQSVKHLNLLWCDFIVCSSLPSSNAVLIAISKCSQFLKTGLLNLFTCMMKGKTGKQNVYAGRNQVLCLRRKVFFHSSQKDVGWHSLDWGGQWECCHVIGNN